MPVISSNDTVVWHYSKDGCYTVKSGYRLIMNGICDSTHLRVPGDWWKLWDLRVPPKIKSFLWRAARDCLSTRVKLATRGVHSTSFCVICYDHFENCWHVSLTCPYALRCWRLASLEHAVLEVIDRVEGFTEFVFHVLNNLSEVDRGKFAMVLFNL